MKKFKINVNGKSYEVEVEELGGSAASQTAAPVITAPEPAPIAPAAKQEPVAPAAPQAAPAGAITVAAPMPGTILSINVNVGDTVTEGQVLVILEAMKMENEIMAPSSGKIVMINTTKGASVNTGDALVSLA